jgi:cytochrome c oxidase accessory protein FixG
MASLLPAPVRVLPTLNADGTRRLIRPKKSPGRFVRARAWVAWSLIVLFVGLPFVKIGGQQAFLLDVVSRKFTLFGRTFLATDGVLLMLLMLAIFVFVIWATAVVGRAWCGWGCPQTVYMEFLYRPIERWIEGDRVGQLRLDRKGGGWRRPLKLFVFALISFGVANVFLAYFVGVDRLRVWMTTSPFEHPTGFLIMSVTAGLMLFDFGWFREQMCTVICPYARLQSVLLDPRSLVVGYATNRGEPRSKGKPKGDHGDCIDCNACVVTCPTGIDIREGLQLECIACAQCIDACDEIMHRIHKPPGLIRYGTAADLSPVGWSNLRRPRVLIYAGVFMLLVTLFVFALGRLGSFDVTVLRGIGAPFAVQDPGNVRNQLRIKVENRTDESGSYRIELPDAPALQLIAPENPLVVASGTHVTTSVFVIAPRSAFVGGKLPVRVSVTDGSGNQRTVDYQLLGPTNDEEQDEDDEKDEHR